jgi:hypothetical protein
MKNLLRLLASCAALGTVANLGAQTVTVDPTTLNLGFMNWSPASGNAAGYGGSGNGIWGLSDLRATFSGSTLTLSPNINAYGDNLTSGPGGTPNPYWINADGSGANIMDANIYNETTGTYVSTTLTFQFDVVANTLVSPYTSVAFIKEFAPDYSSFTQQTVALTPGMDSVSKLISGNAGDHVQYGFETDGPDANPATAATLGSVILTPTPEPSSLALMGLGILGFLRFRRGRTA